MSSPYASPLKGHAINPSPSPLKGHLGASRYHNFEPPDLNLEKAVLAEQLKKREQEIEKLQSLLSHKNELKKLYNSKDNATLRVEMETGVPLTALRVHHLSVKAQPKHNPYKDIYAMGPPKLSPMGNKKMKDFLQEERLKKAEREAEESRIIEEKREAKKKREPQYPNIKIPPSMLPGRYIRAELPCTIEHGISGHFLSWACPLENLDYEYYLPIFFDGLQCLEQPACFLARQGIEDMLIAAKSHDPQRIISCIRSLVRPLRNALSKYNRDISLGVLKALQQLALCNPSIGKALLPYCKQFIGPISVFLENNRNIGDSIDYGQRKFDDIGEEVRKTLELLEETGGPDAFKYIKFSVPVYESCMIAPDSHHQKPK